jgi:T5SS/PEP-CTERM-associated repeat protein
MATYTWNVGSGRGGAFTDPSSWLDITSGTPVDTGAVPGGDDTIDIGNEAVVTDTAALVVGGDAGGLLTLSNGASLRTTGTQPDHSANVSIGAGSGSVGVIDVSSGAVLDSGVSGLVVGLAGTGTLMVQGGTVLASNTGHTDVEPALVIGSALASDPSVTGFGVVSVTGAGSLVRTVGLISVGDTGAGDLTISDAGTVEVTGTEPAGTANFIIGNDPGSSATVTVTGTSSVLDAGLGCLSIGDGGTGTLMVTQGGTVMASAAGYDELRGGGSSGQQRRRLRFGHH